SALCLRVSPCLIRGGGGGGLGCRRWGGLWFWLRLRRGLGCRRWGGLELRLRLCSRCWRLEERRARGCISGARELAGQIGAARRRERRSGSGLGGGGLSGSGLSGSGVSGSGVSGRLRDWGVLGLWGRSVGEERRRR